MGALSDSQNIRTGQSVAPNPVSDLLSLEHKVEGGLNVELLPYQVPHPVVLRQVARHNIRIAHLIHQVNLLVLLRIVPFSYSFGPLTVGQLTGLRDRRDVLVERILSWTATIANVRLSDLPELLLFLTALSQVYWDLVA